MAYDDDFEFDDEQDPLPDASSRVRVTRRSQARGTQAKSGASQFDDAYDDDNVSGSVYGRASAPLPADSSRRRQFTSSMPSTRERVGSLVVAGICVVLAITLVIVGVQLFLNNGGSGEEAQTQTETQAQGENQGEGENATSEGEGETTETPATSAASLTLSMIGDMVLHPSVYNSGTTDGGATYNLDHLFTHVASELSQSDVRIVSQETILGDASLGYGWNPEFCAPQEVGDAEANAGFNVVLKASDRSLDKGYNGLHSEISFWNEKHSDVTVLGARDVQSDNPASFDTVYVYEKNGIKVAILNYTESTGVLRADTDGAIATLDKQLIERNVEEAKRQADFVVVCAHWGNDGYSSPAQTQIDMANYLCGLGVDVVIGTHPHVLQPVEVITGDDGHQMICYYSIGTFISGYAGDDYMIGGIAHVTFDKSGDTARISGYGLTPVVTHKGDGADETTYLLSDYTADVAATNGAGTTVEYAQQHAADILGENYNAETMRLWVSI